MSTGYSGTPLVRKIGVKPGHRLRLVAAPADWELPGLPEDVTFTDERADVTVAFFGSRAELDAAAGGLAAGLPDAGMLWIAWPRRAAGHESDVTENGLREVFLPLGLVDVKVAALGEDWSGLKFVRRVGERGRGRA